jgi:UDP-N-acetylmuramoyl-tripeptide--D-alanyl-D-alanine ligase
VSIDSRTVGAGELFIAIHGARHDGHAYVAAAIGRGAVAAVVARARVVEYAEPVRKKLIAVEDTLAALQRLAWTARNEWRALGGRRRLAGITGSTGKTTTKEILAALLGARCRVLKNEGNLNNEYGVPLTLLRLEEERDAAVIELGMSHRGEIATLAKICEPEVGVVTCVAPVHLEFFASVEEIAEAKHELIENLAGAAPAAVLNADDARVMKFAEGFRGRVLTFGFGEKADFRAENTEDRGVEGTAFDFVGKAEGGGEERRQDAGGTRARLELPLVGRHNVMNALAALAAASVWGVGAEEAKRVFPTLQPAAMRGEVLKFQDGFTMINDCYNSNPVALASMIGLLASTSGYRRRILAAGEMLELGAESARLHREAGALAASKGIDWIFGVQGMAKEIVRGAEAAGQPSSRARFFSNAEEAAPFLRDFVERGDVVLVKGSRGVKMERIVEAISAKHALARSH